MIAAWMIYTVAITILLYAAANGAEYLARTLGLPTRFVWVAAALAAIALSARAIAPRSEAGQAGETHHAVVSAPRRTGAVERVSRPSNDASPRASADAAVIAQFAEGRPTSLYEFAHRVTASVRAVDVAPLERSSPALAAMWITTSLLVLGWLAASFARLRRITRALHPVVIDEHSVLLSEEFGPALVGLLRPRIVLPRWVLALPSLERRILLAHETEHAIAHDPTLLCLAAVLVALQPWNVALWMIVARLRLAVETDCDHRVLDLTGDARAYARLLIEVYERTTLGSIPQVAFVARPSNLERRIRRVAERPRALSIAGVFAAACVLVLSTAAWTIAAPRRPIAPQSSSVRVSTETRVASAAAVVVAPSNDAPMAQDPSSTRSSADTPVLAPTLAPAPASAASSALASDVSQNAQVVLPEPEPLQAPAPTPTPAPTATTATFVQSSCILGRMIAGSDMPPLATPRPKVCVVDGDLIVRALDSTHVLFALRDSSELPQAHGIAFLVFTVQPGSVPLDLDWNTIGHAEFRDAGFYVSIPTAGARPIAFGGSAASLRAQYPDADRVLVIRALSVMHVSNFDFDHMRTMQPSNRCGVPRDSEWLRCFESGGKQITIR